MELRYIFYDELTRLECLSFVLCIMSIVQENGRIKTGSLILVGYSSNCALIRNQQIIFGILKIWAVKRGNRIMIDICKYQDIVTLDGLAELDIQIK